MQIVGYDSGASGVRYDPVEGTQGAPASPALTLADGDALRRESLDPGRELAFTLGERHCAGAVDGETHESCDADAAPYCEVHTSTWPCAQCRGNCDRPLASCREEHAVYLAAFAPDLFKVGVTRHWRLATRLREQGADRAALIRIVSDGRIARGIESEIAETLVDRVPVAAKVGSLGRAVDVEAWESLASRYEPIETFYFDYGLDLDGTPVTETLATGTVVGTKGRLLVLARNGSTYAVDLRDLVGYEVFPGATDRDLQSSLGAFG